MERGKICVSLAVSNAAAVQDLVQPVLHQVDVIEIRLDAMPDPEVGKCCSLLRKPLLFTNRPIWEGGEFSGFEDDRVRPLFDAIQLQAAYIDYELRADPQLRSQLQEAMQDSCCRMIISWHDFKTTPTAAELDDLLKQMIASKADIGKIVTTAHTPVEVLRVLQLQQSAMDAGFPLSCFCMGEPGQISRLATLYLGGYMSYTALNTEQVTAAGQLSVRQLNQLTTLLAGS